MKYAAAVMLVLLTLRVSSTSCTTKPEMDKWQLIEAQLLSEEFQSLESQSVAIRLKNPGNLKGKNGYRKFKTLKEGLEALEWQIERYQSGRSKTRIRPESDLEAFVATYAPDSYLYSAQLSSWLRTPKNTQIKDIPRDSLVKYLVRKEDHRLYTLIYARKF